MDRGEEVAGTGVGNGEARRDETGKRDGEDGERAPVRGLVSLR